MESRWIALIGGILDNVVDTPRKDGTMWRETLAMDKYVLDMANNNFHSFFVEGAVFISNPQGYTLKLAQEWAFQVGTDRAFWHSYNFEDNMHDHYDLWMTPLGRSILNIFGECLNKPFPILKN